MCSQECKFYEKCEAPICPMDESSFSCVWYPGEDYCRLGKFKDSLLVKNQARINKKFGFKNRHNDPQFDLGYFTYEMLTKGLISVRKSLKGLNPNESEKKQLEKWMNAKYNFVSIVESGSEDSKSKRKLSPEHIAKMQEARKKKLKAGKKLKLNS